MKLFNAKLSMSVTLTLCLAISLLAGCSSDPNPGKQEHPTDGSIPSCKASEKLDGTTCKPIDCSTDANACPNGTTCNADKKCEIRETCAKASDCSTRICQNGACLNPQRCTGDLQCLAGDSCLSSGKCGPSICPQGCKTGGVCNTSTKTCEDAQTCTHGNQRRACTNGKFCGIESGQTEGTCMTADEWKQSSLCKLGVPSVSDAGFFCANKEDCISSDQCVKGYACVNRECILSKCDATSTCSEGVCNPTTGLCENIDGDCTKDNDCISGFLCLFRDGEQQGVCTEKSEDLCKAGGVTCTGLQKCAKDLKNNRPYCEEPSPCASSLDCFDQNRCLPDTAGNTCQSAGTDASPTLSCTAETNVDETSAVDLSGTLKQQYHLCAKDAKNYFFLDNLTQQGEAFATVTLDTLDIGAGSLELSFISKTNGSVLATKTLAAGDVSATVVLPLKSNNDKAVYLQVKALETRPGGLRYSIKGGYLNNKAGIAEACDAAKPITINSTTGKGIVEGNTSNAQVSGLADCNDTSGGQRKKDVWSFTLTQPSKVKISVTPAFGSKLVPVVALMKESCLNPSNSSEITTSGDFCTSALSVQAIDLQEISLAPGNYFVIVSEKSEQESGEYTLGVDTTSVDCAAGEVKCDSTGQYLLSCKADGTYQSNTEGVDCGAGKCNATAKMCEAASCKLPGTLNWDTSNSHEYTASDTVTLVVADNKPFGWYSGKSKPKPYDGVGCLNSYDFSFYGIDHVYKVDVPSGWTLEATLGSTTSNTQDTIVAIAEGCGSNGLYKTCLTTADENAGTPEVATYTNNSSETKELYVYFDVWTYSPVPPSEEHTATFKLKEGTPTPSTSTPSCNYGDIKCDESSKKLSVCGYDSSYSLQYQEKFACSKGCNTNAIIAECKDPDGDMCNSAIELTKDTFSTTYYPFEAHNYSEAPKGCAEITSGGGREFVFKYDVPKDNQPLTITIDHENSGFQPMVWLSKSCDTSGAVGACEYGSDKLTWNSNLGSYEFYAKNKGTYYIVVEPRNTLAATTGSDYKFKIKVEEKADGLCDKPGEAECEGDNVKYCDENNKPTIYPCGSGNKACDSNKHICGQDGVSYEPTGEHCFDAIPIDVTQATQPLTSKTTGTSLRNTSVPSGYFYPQGEVGQCLFNTKDAKSDKEFVYRFTGLTSGDTLVAWLEVAGGLGENESKYIQTYFLTKCTDIDSCVGSRQGGVDKIAYYATSTDDVYFVIETSTHKDLDNKKWELKWEVKKSGACLAGSSRCESDKVVACADDGTSELQPTSCITGSTCLAGGCTPTPDTESCSTAPSLDSAKDSSDSFTYHFTIDPSTAKNKEGGCSISPTKSQVYYRFTATAGQFIDVHLNNEVGGEGLVAAIASADECSNTNAECLAKKESGIRKPVDITYKVPSDGTYVVILAATDDTSKNHPQFGTITLRNKDCSPEANVPECDGDAIKYCADGKFQKYECSGTSSPKCSNATCASATGDGCFDAVELIEGSNKAEGTITGDIFSGKTARSIVSTEEESNTTSGKKSNACIFAKVALDGQEGHADAYYYVDLKKGDLFRVEVSNTGTSDGFYTYLVGNCDEELCFAADAGDKDANRSHTIDYIAPKDGRYHLVVKLGRNAPTSGIDYKIKWKITSATDRAEPAYVCTPFTSECGASANDITLCSMDEAKLTGECITGSTCKDNTCFLDDTLFKKIQSCTTAPTVSKAGSYFVSFDKLKEQDLSRVLFGANGQVGDGYIPAYFKISLQPYQVFKLYSRGAFYNPTIKVFTFTDCGNMTETVTSLDSPNFNGCGASGTDSCTGHDYLTLYEYTAKSQPVEFFLAVALERVGTGTPERLFFDIRDSECNPGEAVTKCFDNNTIQYCSKDGIFEKRACSGAGTCDETTPDAAVCSTPDGDICAEAIPSKLSDTMTEETITGNFKGKKSDYTLPAGNTCTKSTAEGNDVVYKVELKSGQTLTATLKGDKGTDGSSDLALYFLSSCSNPEESCLAGSDQKGNIIGNAWDTAQDSDKQETVTYTATKDETIFVVVDSYFKNLSSDYTLTLKRQ